MDLLATLTLGYLLGCISPAAWISRLKKKDLREHGTGNLGASNTVLVFGKTLGVFVMLFDIFKAYFASRLAQALFPRLAHSGLIAGFAAIAGHSFPFYLMFKGGKGLAAFGGTVLAYYPPFFFGLLIFGVSLMLVCNVSVVLPLSAAILFPFLAFLRTGDAVEALIAGGCSLLLILLHLGNMEKARKHTDIPIRDYIFRKLFRAKE